MINPTEMGRAVRRDMSPAARWFLVAAAAYNALWGLAAIVLPRQLAAAIAFSDSGDGMGWRAAGVVVLAYAPAYLWAADHPRAARPILATAAFGKSIGAVGWIVGLVTGRFPRRTAALPLLNDLIWLPGLIAILRSGERDRDPLAERVGDGDEER